MSDIQWTDETWNPVTGCSKVSAGCKNCYAERLAPRVFAGQRVIDMDGSPSSPLGERPRRFTDVRAHIDRLEQPLRWRKPRRVFVNSISDLFHEMVPKNFLDRVFAVMALSPQHTFQVLTKRPGRMQSYLSWLQPEVLERAAWHDWGDEAECQVANAIRGALGEGRNVGWPLSNVHLGVSCEDQATADERIPILLDTPAAVRFVSLEPLLGPIDLFNVDGEIANAMDPDTMLWPADVIDWVITGGESGPNARPCDVAWIRSIVEQCRATSVPCFVKQLGARWLPDGMFDRGRRSVMRDRKGGDPTEWPEDLRVREFPNQETPA